MNMIYTESWFRTSAAEPRGYIQPEGIKELWFHTGTACNFACPFCLEGSKPGDDRLNRIVLEDIQGYIDEAVELGVEQFSFTGGEPFIVKDIVRILQYAASKRPCLVLTNGSDALLKRLPSISVLRETAQPIAFRISIDYPDQQRHDANRASGSFEQALQSLRELIQLGFKVSLARQMERGEDSQAVDATYRELLKSKNIPSDINIVAFPDFLTPMSHADVPEITESCMTTYQTATQRSQYMCAFSKMIVKQNGKMTIYSCTLVDDDPRYGFVGSLKDCLEQRVMLAHHRCYSCFSCGASCSER